MIEGHPSKEMVDKIMEFIDTKAFVDFILESNKNDECYDNWKKNYDSINDDCDLFARGMIANYFQYEFYDTLENALLNVLEEDYKEENKDEE